MKKTVILSTNDKEEYFGYLPYVQMAWNSLGWDTLTFYLGGKTLKDSPRNKIIRIEPILGYREETILQVVRLLGFRYVDGLVMTSDVDMMPLSKYWNPSLEGVTSYGADLCNYKQYPMCYVAAQVKFWEKLIPEQHLVDLLDKYSAAKSDSFKDWWYIDQFIITERINQMRNNCNENVIFVDRGQYQPLFCRGLIAKGRIDRVRWITTKLSKNVKIDAHLPRPFSKNAALQLLKKYHKLS
jgi:hypothetical protein